MGRSTRLALGILGLLLVMVVAAGAAAPAQAEHGKPRALAAQPYMGWSSWSTFRCDPGPSEALILAQATALHRQLQAHGYRYVNADACWANGIDGFGRLAPDPRRFPNGIASLSARVHAMGLKFGMYLYPGMPVQAVQQNTPIEGTPFHAQDVLAQPLQFASTFKLSYKIDFARPGAQAFVDSWARQLAGWGVDFLKLDSVAPGSSDNSFDTRPDVQAWSTALHRTGRPLWLELSWHIDIAAAPFWRTYANGWRTDDDIECYGSGGCTALTAWANPLGYVRDTISSRFFDAAPWARWAGPGGWSDLDSLDVGNGAADGLTPDERRSAVTLWSIAGAPLSSGDDLTRLDATGLSLLTNDEVIAVDQAGAAGAPVRPASDVWSLGPGYGDEQVWRAAEPDGSLAVAFFNLGSAPATVGTSWQSIGFCGTAGVRDLWNHSDLGRVRDGFSAPLAAHASRLLRVTPEHRTACPPPAPAPVPSFFEAESAQNTLGGGASVSSCGGCSGGSKVGNLFNGSAVQFNEVSVPAAGPYTLTLYYATGDERTGFVSVNGGPEATIGFFPRTGSYDTVGSYTTQVQLRAGSNTIRYGTHAGTYSPDLDRISVAPLTTA